MHSFRPVPSTMTSYSSSLGEQKGCGGLGLGSEQHNDSRSWHGDNKSVMKLREIEQTKYRGNGKKTTEER